jgi:hypothetical protein
MSVAGLDKEAHRVVAFPWASWPVQEVLEVATTLATMILQVLVQTGS